MDEDDEPPPPKQRAGFRWEVLLGALAFGLVYWFTRRY